MSWISTESRKDRTLDDGAPLLCLAKMWIRGTAFLVALLLWTYIQGLAALKVLPFAESVNALTAGGVVWIVVFLGVIIPVCVATWFDD